MDSLKPFSSAMEAFAARLGEQLTTTEQTILFVVFAVLCLISIASARFAAVFGGILLAALGCFLFTAPDATIFPLAVGAFFGSLIVSVGGILSRRRERVLQRALESLKQSVQNLEFAAERHTLQALSHDAASAESTNSGDHT